MMDPKFNPETAKIYHFRYMREYRAVAVLWAILTIIWCILNVVAFVQPQWIGDTEDPASGFGHLGLYKYCEPDLGPNTFGKYICTGEFSDFDKILNDEFKAATFFCGVAALLMLICVAALLLFFCFKKAAVFVFCGILELVCAIFIFLACVIYPAGWDHDVVKRICPSAGEYDLGECNMRWAYILAIIGIFDALILAVLAFFLASKRAKIEIYSTAGTVTKSELNGYSETVSKKSIPIQPQVVAVPAHDGEHDRYSEFSRHSDRPRSRGGFQL